MTALTIVCAVLAAGYFVASWVLGCALDDAMQTIRDQDAEIESLRRQENP